MRQAGNSMAAAAPRSPAAPMPAATHFRPIVVADIDAVMAVEAGAYSHPWTRGNFIDSMAAGYEMELLQADSGHAILGYSVVMRGAGESHLLNLTVTTARQRCGFGRHLLERAIHRCAARGDDALWLEVRLGNTAAQALYRGAGFEIVGRRAAYYPAEHGREDALVMRLVVIGSANHQHDGAADALD